MFSNRAFQVIKQAKQNGATHAILFLGGAKELEKAKLYYSLTTNDYAIQLVARNTLKIMWASPAPNLMNFEITVETN